MSDQPAPTPSRRWWYVLAIGVTLICAAAPWVYYRVGIICEWYVDKDCADAHGWVPCPKTTPDWCPPRP